jgi:glycosyltransferase involved in cell wall biosynthesis
MFSPMSRKPLTSVVIPAYNRRSTIGNAIQSVLAQPARDLEVIVVDDGSSDDSSAVVLRMAHSESRIRLIRHKANRGAQAARNTGIQAARGEWVAFLDSDDTWVPNSLNVRIVAARSRKSKSSIHLVL